MSKVFLSYSHADINTAKKIYSDLKVHNLDIWFDAESLLPGQDWGIEIEKAIEVSEYFIAILSSKSVNNIGYLQRELKTAFEKLLLYPEGRIYIIPVRIDNCNPINSKIKKLHWIDLFPANKYKSGIRKILKVLNPIIKKLRYHKADITEIGAQDMIRRFNYYDRNINRTGEGIKSKYKIIIDNEIRIVFDPETGLTWLQSGTKEPMTYPESQNWIKKLNDKCYAGYNNWHLPTLEEAMSLVKPYRNEMGLHIDQLFDNEQKWIWTCDKLSNSKEKKSKYWIVYFTDGFSYHDINSSYAYIRPVCF